MRTERGGGLCRAAALATLLVLAGAAPRAAAAAEEAAAGGAAALAGADWESWTPDNEVQNLASLQRGARDFMNYCVGCHSLKYLRYSRMAQDLHIPTALLETELVIPGDKPNDYILTPMPAEDSAQWFGKTPPDLSLESRLRGTAWIYQYLLTFYADPSHPTTGVNNLRFETTAMPHVLSSLQGLRSAVFRNVQERGSEGQVMTVREFAGFAPDYVVTGSLTPAQYADFVRDLVNFLDYVGEPSQVGRRQLGIWVVLFLFAFTAIAWFLKKEYWRDVK